MPPSGSVATGYRGVLRLGVATNRRRLAPDGRSFMVVLLLLIVLMPHLRAQQESWQELNARAVALQKQGKFDEAIPVAQQALRVAEATFGAAHSNVATALNNLALLYTEKGKYAEAEPLYQRALAIEEKGRGPDDPEVATGLTNLAGLFEAEAKYAAAEPLYQRALKIREKALGPEHPSVALLLNNLGVLYSEKAKYADAEAVYQRALKIQEKALGPDHADVAGTLNNLAALYDSLGQYAAAEPLLRQSLEIAEKTLGPQHPYLASALNNLALVCKRQGKYAEAEALYQRALSIAEKALGPAHPNVAAFLDNLGGLYSARGQYDAAELLYRRALKIREQALGPDHPAVAASLNDLASVYREQGKFGAAEKLFQRALAVLEKARGPDHPDLAAPLSNLAGIFSSEGNYAAAEPLQQRALKIAEKAYGPDHPAVATALNNLATLYENSGRLSAAEPLYQRALAMVEKGLGPEHPAVAISLGNLAGVYLAEEKYDAAEPLYKRGLSLREKAPDNPEIANSLNSLAVLYHRQRKYATAEPLYRRALEVQEQALGPLHPQLQTTLRNLGTLEYAQDHAAKAEPLYGRAVQILKQESDQHFTYMSERERLLFLDAVAPAFPLYFSFCFTYRQQAPELVGKMYDVVLWKKGFVVESMGALRTVVETSGGPEARALLEKLSAKKSELAKLLAEKAKDLAQWRRHVEQLEGETNQLERELVGRSALLGEQRRLKSVTWRDVQKSLQASEAAVEFVKFDYHDGKDWTDKTYYVALVVTRSMTVPALVLVGDATTVEKSVLRDYRNYVRLERLPIAAAERFSDLLWKPLEPVLAGAKRIYLSPDAILNQVSLGSIPAPDGQLLMEKYDLHIVSSTRDLLRPPLIWADKSAVLAGNPDFNATKAALASGGSTEVSAGASDPRSRELSGESLPQLPATEIEVDAIGRLLGRRGWHVEAHKAEKASEESIKQLRRPRLLHIATHGFFQPDQRRSRGQPGAERPSSAEDPMLRSGLFFSGANRALSGSAPLDAPDDGVLTAYEATGLNLQGTELVVLSACQTGLGEVLRGEGVFGLRRALQEAGAQSVLMSMWSVPDRETQELMTRFYSHWLSGVEKHEALRKAQLEQRAVVKKRYGEDLPYYWGAFVLAGR